MLSIPMREKSHNNCTNTIALPTIAQLHSVISFTRLHNFALYQFIKIHNTNQKPQNQNPSVHQTDISKIPSATQAYQKYTLANRTALDSGQHRWFTPYLWYTKQQPKTSRHTEQLPFTLQLQSLQLPVPVSHTKQVPTLHDEQLHLASSRLVVKHDCLDGFSEHEYHQWVKANVNLVMSEQ